MLWPLKMAPGCTRMCWHLYPTPNTTSQLSSRHPLSLCLPSSSVFLRTNLSIHRLTRLASIFLLADTAIMSISPLPFFTPKSLSQTCQLALSTSSLLHSPGTSPVSHAILYFYSMVSLLDRFGFGHTFAFKTLS